MKRIASLLLFLLAGCAAAPVTQGSLPVNPAYSRALNFAIAAGETDEPIGPFLIDRPAAEVAQLNPPTTTRGGEHPAVTLGYAAANAVNPAPGISPAVGAGFSVLSLLTALPTYTPGQQDSAGPCRAPAGDRTGHDRARAVHPRGARSACPAPESARPPFC